MIRKYTLFQFIPQKLVHWCELQWILGHLPERMDIVRNRTQQYKSEAIARSCDSRMTHINFGEQIGQIPGHQLETQSGFHAVYWYIPTRSHKQVAATFASQMVTLASFIVVYRGEVVQIYHPKAIGWPFQLDPIQGLANHFHLKIYYSKGPCFNMKTNMFQPPWKNMPGSWDHTPISRV